MLRRTGQEEEKNGPAVMEQLPYCLHNSQWNSLEFADERARGSDSEEGGEMAEVMALRRCDEEVNVARQGIRYRPPKLENFIPEDSVKCLCFLLKSNL